MLAALARRQRWAWSIALVCVGGWVSGCGARTEKFPGLDGYEFPLTAGKYTVLSIRTDGKDESRAKANAEDALTRHPEIKAMVGLWAYNPPAIVAALEGQKKEGKVQVIGFDENPTTLKAIESGAVYGTIAQKPFIFGYKSVEYLAAMLRNQPVAIPESKILTVPVTVVTKENIKEFNAIVEAQRAGKGEPPKPDRADYDTTKPVTVGFVTNSVDPFWTLAEEGCKLAAKAFNATALVRQPPNGTVEDQKRMLEELRTQKCEAIAVSPIDPEGEKPLLDDIADAMPLICHDSDAPKTKRRFYIGTSNYLAGREAGKLLKKALPEGGKVMIFVGKIEVLNAQERARGLVEELLDKPIPPEIEKYKSLDLSK